MSQFYAIHPENPQARLISQAVAQIREGGVVIYPTDSGYALGCLLENKSALERICRIRQIDSSHNFTLVCRDLSELSLAELQGFSGLITDDVFAVLTLEGSVAARNHIGGTAPAQVKAAIERASARLAALNLTGAST